MLWWWLWSSLAFADPDAGLGPLFGDPVPPPPPPPTSETTIVRIGANGAVSSGEARRALEDMQSQIDFC
jgi:hypothetical protein